MDKSEVVQLPVVPLNAALALFGDHLQDIEEACTDNILWDIERLTREEPRNEIQEEVDRLAIVAATKEKLRSLKQVKARIEYAQYPERFLGKITDAMIERAKNKPLEELYDGTLVRHMGKCPFHEENTGSFHIRKDNTFICYGCKEWGDSIAFYMKKNQATFTKAVRALQV